MMSIGVQIPLRGVQHDSVSLSCGLDCAVQRIEAESPGRAVFHDLQVCNERAVQESE
jgi:hypothetical protein